MVQTVSWEIKCNVHRHVTSTQISFATIYYPNFAILCLGKYKLVVLKYCYESFPSLDSFFIEENLKTVAVIEPVIDLMP